MFKQKPTAINLDVQYVCPKCNSQIWMTLKQLQAYGKIICHVCDKVFIPKIPRSVVLKYGDKNIERTRPLKTESSSLLNYFLATFVNLGYKKTEIKDVIEKSLKDGKYSGNDEEFIKHIITSI